MTSDGELVTIKTLTDAEISNIKNETVVDNDDYLADCEPVI